MDVRRRTAFLWRSASHDERSLGTTPRARQEGASVRSVTRIAIRRPKEAPSRDQGRPPRRRGSVFPPDERQSRPANAQPLVSSALLAWAHDPIGVAEINYEDVVAALESEQVYQVKVADQTDNQLLFVGISVTAE